MGFCFSSQFRSYARVAGLEVPMPYAKNLERATLPFADDVVAAVKAMVQKQY